MRTIEEIRHANLHLLASSGHSQASLARLLDIDRRQVNQWFVEPPIRDLSSEYARVLEGKLLLERGSMDHEDLGASHPARFDLEKLADAIRIVLASTGDVNAKELNDAYELLCAQDRKTPADELPISKRSAGGSANGSNRRGSEGTGENSGRQSGKRKKGAS